MTTKPLCRLARAANALGSNLQHPPLAETPGPREVREASIAFNRMQASIQSYIQERTFMLSAIAHDLQTPLTRLRLRLEKVSDPALRTALVSDLTVTQSLVREVLDYAHTITTDEPFELVDIDSLTEALCNDAIDAGSEITFDGTSNTTILGSPLALRRCISNLMDNAIKYGQFAHVSVQKSAGKAVISVIDGGQGIPAQDLEKVFQPFHRLEDSRSRDSGGTGLGLTIARIIAERHRGRITLKNMGVAELGLIAILELPLAPASA
jgi:signal transduction histidine kinase